MSRVALYYDLGGSGLTRCHRAAAAAGDRGGVVAAEEAPSAARNGSESTLSRLVARLKSGEFDSIVADLGPDDCSPLCRLVLREEPIGGEAEHLTGAGPLGGRTAIYGRHANSMQAAASVGDQVSRCQKYAMRRGWVMASAYSDTARGSTTFTGRRGFAQMLAAALRGDFATVLVEDVDRLNRNVADLDTLAVEVERLGVVIRTMSGETNDCKGGAQ